MGVYGMSVLKKENLGGFVKRMVIVLCFLNFEFNVCYLVCSAELL